MCCSSCRLVSSTDHCREQCAPQPESIELASHTSRNSQRNLSIRYGYRRSSLAHRRIELGPSRTIPHLSPSIRRDCLSLPNHEATTDFNDRASLLLHRIPPVVHPLLLDSFAETRDPATEYALACHYRPSCFSMHTERFEGSEEDYTVWWPEDDEVRGEPSQGAERSDWYQGLGDQNRALRTHLIRKPRMRTKVLLALLFGAKQGSAFTSHKFPSFGKK